MDQPQLVYLRDMAAQLSSLSAFLGGFSATFLATLLALSHKSRVLTLAVGASCASAVAFVVAVVASSMLNAMLHPAAPKILALNSAQRPQAIMTLAFGLGIFALLFAIGCSGWLRSRSTGWATTIISLLGAVLVASLTVTVG